MTNNPKDEIIHRKLEKNAENPGVQVAEVVAELEGEEVTNIRSMYNCVDGVVDNVFSNPPAEEAQLQVTFSFEGYRVTIDQTGEARFVKTE